MTATKSSKYCSFCWTEADRRDFGKWFSSGTRHALVCKSCDRLLWKNYTTLEDFYDHICKHSGYTRYVFSSFDVDELRQTRDWRVYGKTCGWCLQLSYSWHKWYGPPGSEICLCKSCDYVLWRDYVKLEWQPGYIFNGKTYHRYLQAELYKAGIAKCF